MLDDATLFQELDSHGRRRLWLLQFLLGKLEPDEALNVARRMENFILGIAAPCGTKSNIDAGGWEVRSASAAARDDGAEAQRRARLLDQESLREFVEGIAAGRSNTELASRFGFTPRQANGLRMGLAKRNPALRAPAPPRVGKPSPLDRATELKLQEAFLRQKERTAATLDDVVQFLRQRGDIVYRSGSGFSVNNRLTLTTEELIARANKKRSELGQAPFAAPVAAAAVSPPD